MTTELNEAELVISSDHLKEKIKNITRYESYNYDKWKNQSKAEFYIHKLKGALMFRGENGEITPELQYFIRSCFNNDIKLDVELI